MPALLAACPSFASVWREIVTDWTAAEERGPYTDLGFFAHHLVSLLDRGETAEFATVFATVEGLFRGGDDAIRYLLKVGLLEDLGNIASNPTRMAICRALSGLAWASRDLGLGRASQGVGHLRPRCRFDARMTSGHPARSVP
jgi:hypothetical protein